MASVFWLLALFAVTTSASPLPRHRNAQEYVKYDQRQEGEFNVRADLENFVILLIPASAASPSPSPTSSLGLLDLLSKSIPLKKRGNKHAVAKKDATIESFIESKTAPYHVDIDANHQGDDDEEGVKKQHPELNGAAARLSRAFVITVPLDEGVVVKKEAKKELLKKKYAEGEMKLLGAENEQCGPGLSRDKDGICRVNKV